MSTADEQLTNHIAAALAEGQIPLGSLHISIASTKQDVLNLIGDMLVGTPREWAAQSSAWARYALTSEILWYPRQQVSFTFRDERLMLVEFYDPTEPDTRWDYPLETQKYLRMKQKLAERLGTETRCSESNKLNMEVLWSFPRLLVNLTCDAKTGGCGLSLQPRAQ